MGGSTQKTESEQQIKLPEWVDQQARVNQKMANAVAQKPYMAYTGPTTAAFNPMQLDAAQNVNKAANAYGMAHTPVSGKAGDDQVLRALLGLPAPETTKGGFKGYSSQPIYNEAKNDLSDYERRFIDRFFMDPRNGRGSSHPFTAKVNLGLKNTHAQNLKQKRKYYQNMQTDGSIDPTGGSGAPTPITNSGDVDRTPNQNPNNNYTPPTQPKKKKKKKPSKSKG